MTSILIISIIFGIINPSLSIVFKSNSKTNCAILCYSKCSTEGLNKSTCMCNFDNLPLQSCENIDFLVDKVDTMPDVSSGETVYKSAHTIAISIDAHQFAYVYIFEYAYANQHDGTIINNDDDDIWDFAGVSFEPTFLLNIPDPCRDYQFRVIMVLTGRVAKLAMFSPKLIQSTLPDFVVDINEVKYESPVYDSSDQSISISIIWSLPAGYDQSDILGYEPPAVFPLQCLTPEEDLPQPEIEQLSNGGRLRLRLSASILRDRCRLWFEVKMLPQCRQRLAPITIQQSIQLDCDQLPAIDFCRDEMVPKCTDVIDVWGASSNTTIMWQSPKRYGRPLYYHVRYGPAEIQGSPPVMSWKITSRRDLKTDGNETSVELHLDNDIAYGVQVCAVYTEERKRPKFGLVRVTPFICTECKPNTRLPPGRQCNCTKLETPFGPNFCPPSGLCRNSNIRNAPSSGAIWYSNSESDDDDDENDIINNNRESVKTDNHKLNYWQSYRQNSFGTANRDIILQKLQQKFNSQTKNMSDIIFTPPIAANVLNAIATAMAATTAHSTDNIIGITRSTSNPNISTTTSPITPSIKFDDGSVIVGNLPMTAMPAYLQTTITPFFNKKLKNWSPERPTPTTTTTIESSSSVVKLSTTANINNEQQSIDSVVAARLQQTNSIYPSLVKYLPTSQPSSTTTTPISDPSIPGLCSLRNGIICNDGCLNNGTKCYCPTSAYFRLKEGNCELMHGYTGKLPPDNAEFICTMKYVNFSLHTDENQLKLLLPHTSASMLEHMDGMFVQFGVIEPIEESTSTSVSAYRFKGKPMVDAIVPIKNDMKDPIFLRRPFRLNIGVINPTKQRFGVRICEYNSSFLPDPRKPNAWSDTTNYDNLPKRMRQSNIVYLFGPGPMTSELARRNTETALSEQRRVEQAIWILAPMSGAMLLVVVISVFICLNLKRLKKVIDRRRTRNFSPYVQQQQQQITLSHHRSVVQPTNSYLKRGTMTKSGYIP